MDVGFNKLSHIWEVYYRDGRVEGLREYRHIACSPFFPIHSDTASRRILGPCRSWIVQSRCEERYKVWQNRWGNLGVGNCLYNL